MTIRPNITVIAAIFAAAVPFASAETGTPDSNAVACFAETQRIGMITEASALSTASCDLALAAGPYTRQHRASVLFNRALIEQARGESFAAMASLNSAIAEDGELVEALLARAQLAHRQGDYATAVVGYEQLLEQHARTGLVQRHRNAIQSNLEAAQQSLVTVAIR